MAALFATGGKNFQKVGLLSAESGHFCKDYSEGFWPLTFPSAVDLWFRPFSTPNHINSFKNAIYTGNIKDKRKVYRTAINENKQLRMEKGETATDGKREKRLRAAPPTGCCPQLNAIWRATSGS